MSGYIAHRGEGGGATVNGFYQAFAPTSFTLLGLRLIVVQARHAEWRRSALHRRRTYAITLNSALPGLMGLLSLVDPTDTTIWRASFAAVVGAIAIPLIVGPKPSREGRGVPLAALVAASVFVLYVLVVVLALAPSLLPSLGVDLNALRGEAILLSLIVFLGINVAWLLMFDELND